MASSERLNKLTGLSLHRSREKRWAGPLACDANYSACWRNKGAADAGLILFWQVDYCCNNIRLVLVMQTASTYWSLACARVSAVHCVPLNWVDTGVQAGQASAPFLSSSPHILPPFSTPPLASFLRDVQTSLNCKNIPTCTSEDSFVSGLCGF